MKPETLLEIQKCQKNADSNRACMHEQEGVYNLFKGAIAFFKNPSSHRTINYDNKLVAIEIIALAELLLQILSTAQPRP